ncbi:MAG: 2,3-bisphosphoglycerate-independent phosphoglycerate mutase [Bacteroidetes bacterium]|nr:2,3-bisphosphoglycerate-independent phosphoglycerate mutase [Bacteroidota bacterium]
MNKKVILIILDGWGIATKPEVSAIDQAHTPFMDSCKKYPHSKLHASGEYVGLPQGQMGNSEVGHMNIGAGRVVNQDLVRINKAVKENFFENDNILTSAFDHAKQNGKNVHFIGLVSDGGIHSHIDHLKALCTAAQKHQIKNLFVHAFTDGRDTDPKSGIGFLKELEAHLQKTTGQLASVVGRYYAMDRDKRWERIKLAYDLLVNGIGTHTRDIDEAMKNSYDEVVTDEFIKPILLVDDNDQPVATIKDGDVVLCFNFRTDRGRQITQVLSQKARPDPGHSGEGTPEHNMKKLNLYYVTLTNYDNSFQNVHIIFEKDNLNNTLGAILAKNGKKQIRIAETEKYPHVTFFFSGGQEEEFEGEKRILCPSPKVATYDLKPEMSALHIRDAIVEELNKQEVDFVCLNFANPDMVGHTGVFDAAVKACETVDQCAEAVVNAALKNGYTSLIIADHGNSDIMINDDGSPHTTHTTNLVPCILVDKNFDKPIRDGKLGDLAPTILELMGIAKPEEMTGSSLL